MADRSNQGVREMKFVLDSAGANAVLGWMRSTLAPDPHGALEAGDAYRVQSIYLDTPQFDVFHRRGSYGRAKFRVRRYNEDDVVFLERKLKRSGVVRKRRTIVNPETVAKAGDGGDGNGWVGNWFARRLALRRLIPAVMLNYLRVARYLDTPEGRVRVTLDRELSATPVSRLTVPARIQGPDLLEGRFVLEVKFAESMPALLRERVEAFGLHPSGCSKYRLAIQRCGLAVPETAAADDAADLPVTVTESA